MVKYKVYDNKTGEDITSKRFWLIGADGKLYYDDYDIVQASSFAHYVVIQED